MHYFSLSSCSVYLILLKCALVYSSSFTKQPRVAHPSLLLQSHPDDEDELFYSSDDWGSGSGEFDPERWTDDEDEAPATRRPTLKVTTPDPFRITCVVCSGDQACRDPYVRNESHVQACPSSSGCLKVVTPSGDTYRNCLYGFFARVEQTSGCHVIKEEHVGHRFVVNATICTCHTNECNGAGDMGSPASTSTSLTTTHLGSSSVSASSTASPTTPHPRMRYSQQPADSSFSKDNSTSRNTDSSITATKSSAERILADIGSLSLMVFVLLFSFV